MTVVNLGIVKRVEDTLINQLQGNLFSRVLLNFRNSMHMSPKLKAVLVLFLVTTIVGILCVVYLGKITGDRTLLIIQASGGNTRAVKFLISLGIDVNERVKHGETAVLWAATNGHEDTMITLIQAGADVNTRCDDGSSVLNHAAFGKPEMVKILLAYGANPNLKRTRPSVDWIGDTALITAVQHGRAESVKLLLNASADPSVLSNEGKSIFQYAQERGNPKILAILKPIEEKMTPGKP